MKFDWDEAKNLANQKKHGVSFEEAESLLQPMIILKSSTRSILKARNALSRFGLIRRGLIVVVWSLPDEERARIISARLATRKEEGLYEAYMGKRHD